MHYRKYNHNYRNTHNVCRLISIISSAKQMLTAAPPEHFVQVDLTATNEVLTGLSWRSVTLVRSVPNFSESFHQQV